MLSGGTGDIGNLDLVTDKAHAGKGKGKRHFKKRKRSSIAKEAAMEEVYGSNGNNKEKSRSTMLADYCGKAPQEVPA